MSDEKKPVGSEAEKSEDEELVERPEATEEKEEKQPETE